MPVYKVLLSWYRYAHASYVLLHTKSLLLLRSDHRTGDQLPDHRLVSRAREARVHFAPRETTDSLNGVLEYSPYIKGCIKNGVELSRQFYRQH